MLKKCTLRFRKNYTLLIFSLMLAISLRLLTSEPRCSPVPTK